MDQPLTSFEVEKIGTAYYADLDLWSVLITTKDSKIFCESAKTLGMALEKTYRAMVIGQ